MRMRLKLFFLGVLALLTFAIFVSGSSIGRAMSDFTYQADLSFIQKNQNQGLSVNFLKQELEKRGYFASTSTSVNDYKISERNNELKTSNLAIIQLINLMRIYYQKFPKRAYLLLNLVESKKSCLVIDWPQILPSWSWQQGHEVSLILPEKVFNACEVKAVGAFESLYKDLSNSEIKRKFFNKNGALKVDQFPKLAHNREFIAFLILRGFYPTLGDEEGYLVLE
ncbi:MAG: hypothetical protein HQK50_16075 [Oligoflexia bacterium]|nr:hypothetical protein [Oligoflexia bacterium]MBF0367093.1 hypothetical protein [Oligoflexia bacterium]